MVGEFTDFPLRQTLLLVQESHGLGFLDWIHLKADKVLCEGWQFVDVLRLNYARGDGDVFQDAASREATASRNEAEAASLSFCHDYCLKKAVGADGFCETLNALVGDALPQGGTVHVYLVNSDVLLHRVASNCRLIVAIFSRQVNPARLMVSPQSPLPIKIKT